MHCVDCGTLFEQTAGRGRPRVRCSRCSPEQRKPVGEPAARRLYVTPRERECPNCAVSFTALYALTKFCSRKCGIVYDNRRWQEAARDRSPRPCAHCGTEFAPAYGDLRQSYCSSECLYARRALRDSGSTHKRRARRFGCAIEKVDRIAVFDRDGWKCQICGIDTPRTSLGTREHDAPELDHVIPLAQGGAHSFANTQCACRDCNNVKGNRTPAQLDEALAA